MIKIYIFIFICLYDTIRYDTILYCTVQYYSILIVYTNQLLSWILDPFGASSRGLASRFRTMKACKIISWKLWRGRYG